MEQHGGFCIYNIGLAFDIHEMENVDTERRSSARIEEGRGSPLPETSPAPSGDGDCGNGGGDDGDSERGGHAAPSPLAHGANPLAMYSVLFETPTATTTTLWALVVRSSYSK